MQAQVGIANSLYIHEVQTTALLGSSTKTQDNAGCIVQHRKASMSSSQTLLATAMQLSGQNIAMTRQ